MNAHNPISWEKRIPLLPPGSAILIIANPGKTYRGIKPGDKPCAARIEGEDMLFERPERGWISGPLTGPSSWQTAWDNMQIDIWILKNDHYQQLEEWSDLISLRA